MIAPSLDLRIDRRGFLKRALWAGAAAAAGSWSAGCTGAPAGVPSGYRPRFFTPSELAVLHALLEVILPPRRGLPTIDDARLAERIDLELTYHDGEAVQDDFRTVLTLVEYGPFLTLHWQRFSTMAPAQRARFLERVFHRGPALLRQAVVAVKMVAMLLYYSDDRTWERIGYRGPFVVRKLPEASNALESLPS